MGLALGFQTRIAALMIAIFLLPTFVMQYNFLKTYPKMLEKLLSSLSDEGPIAEAQRLGRHTVHTSEVGWQTNVIYFLLALHFMLRGSIAFGLDNQIKSTTGFESPWPTKGKSCRFSPLETPSVVCPQQAAGFPNNLLG